MALSGTQRITLIREVAARLSNENWQMMELTLKTFAIDMSSDWGGGTRQDYAVHYVQNASDEALVEIAKHFGFTLDKSIVSSLDPTFWVKGQLKIFLSHLSTEKVWVSKLQEELARRGVSAFVAHKDIEPTTEWQNQIDLALMTCDGLIALLHPKFHESKWTDQEIGFAMGRGVPVFSVRLGEDPYGFIGRFQAINGGESPGVLADTIIEAYCRNKQTQKQMSDLLIQLLIDSNCYSDAIFRSNLLSHIAVWNNRYEQRLLDALVENSQLSGAFGVSTKIKAFIEAKKPS